MLPFTHATSWTNFHYIVRDGFLRPFRCPVFRRELVYFFYGSVAHRASKEKLRWGRSESPVVLVFKPQAVEVMRWMFPLDTGALACGRLDLRVKDIAGSLRFDVTPQFTPWCFIPRIYGTFASYRHGRRTTGSVTDPRLKLFSHILDGQSERGAVDYRRFSLEYQAITPVPLNTYLVAVWIPEERMDEMQRLNLPVGITVNGYEHGNCPKFLLSSYQLAHLT